MRCLIVLLLSVLLTVTAMAANTSVDPSRIAVGARSLAMGRVSAADPGNINSLFINPANAAALNNWGVTSMYTSLLEGEMNYQLLGGAKNLLGGTVGLAYLGGSSTGLAVTSLDATGRVVPTGTTFDYGNSTITLAYGKALNPALAAGSSLKVVSKSFGSQGSGNGYSLELGVLFNPREELNLGLAAQNVVGSLNWGTGANESLAFGLKGGLNYKAGADFTLAADADLTPLAFHAGAEWKPSPLLAVRGGLERIPTGNSSAALNLMAGLGFALKGINFDYAYLMDGALAANSTHYFTLAFLPAVAPTSAAPAIPVAAPPPVTPAPVIAPAPVVPAIILQPVKPALKKAPAKSKKKVPAKKTSKNNKKLKRASRR
ncbi:MAG: hypothetical protein WC529_00510 [Candidatus Margulisiibacteriota bacterium]